MRTLIASIVALLLLSGCGQRSPTEPADEPIDAGPHPCEDRLFDQLDPYGWEACLAEFAPWEKRQFLASRDEFKNIASRTAGLHGRTSLPILVYGSTTAKCGAGAAGCVTQNSSGQWEIVVARSEPACVAVHETMHWLFFSVGDHDHGHGAEFRCALLGDYRSFGWVSDADYERLQAACA